MNILRLVVVGLFISQVIACGNDPDNEKKQGAIPEHQMNALDKAKQVEKGLLDTEEERKKRID